MEKVLLKKEDVRQAVISGDNCDGRWMLRVEPDGDCSVVWKSQNRRNAWRDEDELFAIPALTPDGSGRESEDACRMLQNLDMSFRKENVAAMRQYWSEHCDENAPEDWEEFVSAFKDKFGKSSIDVCEEFFADDWETNREEAVDFLLDEFLSALNGTEGDDCAGFYDRVNEDGDELTAQPRFEYEWEME